MTAALDGWEHTEFTADDRTREVFRRGDGPGVIVIHEIPGITPKVARFANDLVASGSRLPCRRWSARRGEVFPASTARHRC